MHIDNTCIIMYHIHISSHFKYVSIHIPYISGYPAGVTPTKSQRRHAGPIPSWCGDRSRSTLDGAEEGIPPGLRWEIGRFCGECVTKSWGKPWGKWGKPGFKLLDSGGFLKLMFGSTQILGKWVFLEVADPKLSVVIPTSPFSVGNQRFWGTPRLQFKAPHNCMG